MLSSVGYVLLGNTQSYAKPFLGATEVTSFVQRFIYQLYICRRLLPVLHGMLLSGRHPLCLDGVS